VHESCTLGSERGAPSNGRPYRNPPGAGQEVTRYSTQRHALGPATELEIAAVVDSTCPHSSSCWSDTFPQGNQAGRILVSRGRGTSTLFHRKA
jgi:hypothetical protein